ncbi:VOC family protein [Thalassovita aquimarina]|uniref:VOC family protein n=1 Tax=Thalassovita aquimarina TaxID=2785917 RepID=A0ABS5HRP3_9RHOB|nr:VOC family protein [Thalassovita aquimarina]MBR9651654.1 VOC family protein [Thalassovita aquimarina]
MEQRVSLITLAVDDLDRSTSFYDALGWQREETLEGIIVYDLLGQSLGLYPKADLARDMGLAPEDLGTGAMTLACNQRDKASVDAVAEAARAAGARILKEPHEVFWGGYIAYFADPDGHVWEIAHNPFSPLRDDGAFRWQGYGEK